MKNNIKVSKMIGFKKVVAVAVERAMAANGNSTCAFVVHKPKLPKSTKSSASSDYGASGARLANKIGNNLVHSNVIKEENAEIYISKWMISIEETTYKQRG